MPISIEKRIIKEIEKELARGSRRINALEIAERVSTGGTHEVTISRALNVCEAFEKDGKLVSYLRIPTYANSKKPDVWRHHYRIVG